MKCNNVLFIEKRNFQVIEGMQKPTSWSVTQIIFQVRHVLRATTNSGMVTSSHLQCADDSRVVGAAEISVLKQSPFE